MQQPDLKDSTDLPDTGPSASNKRSTHGGVNYSCYLEQQGIPFSYKPPYIWSGNPDENPAWLIHVSVVRQQFQDLIEPVIDYLRSGLISFAIPIDADHHSAILDGRKGFNLTGKAINLRVCKDDEALVIVKRLITLTRYFNGPAIPCAYALSSCLAVSYGTLFPEPQAFPEKQAIFYDSFYADVLRQTLSSAGKAWPFRSIKPIKSQKQPHLLKWQYIPVTPLKSEPKGNVIKALKVNVVYNMQWCILKQGRLSQSFDNTARDQKDRLKWQMHVHRLLEPKSVLPKVIEYFELHGDGFLAMEYLEAMSLSEKAVCLSEGTIWRFMSVDRKRELIDHALQVVRTLSAFHEAGIVHRDVTPANFLVNGENKVYAIDIELSCDIRSGQPAPPFTLGTPGYLSPEQYQGYAPSFKDDIYGLGALLINLFTGILPNKFNTGSTTILAEALGYFIESGSLVTMIASCVHPDPQLRPDINDIECALSIYDALLLTGTQAPEHMHDGPFTYEQSYEIISGACHTLIDQLVPDKANSRGYTINSGKTGCITQWIGSATLPNDLAAITTILTCAKTLGFSIPNLDRLITPFNNYPFSRRTNAEERTEETDDPCLAIVLRRLKGTLLKESVSKFGDEIFVAGSIHNETLSITGGLTGTGLAILACTNDTGTVLYNRQLAGIIKTLMEKQQPDGSWLTATDPANRKPLKVTGFMHGVAGITYCLLEYYSRFKSPDLSACIMAALEWLEGQRILQHGKRFWPVCHGNTTVDPWLEHGFSGIALTFIKAYEVLGISEYRQIASEVLGYHPVDITSNYFSFGNGLSGLGEIYLEAFKIFKAPEWKTRADTIAAVLLRSSYRDDEGTAFWLDGTQLQPIPDFWTGNSGIIHFLLRCTAPDKIDFPFHLIH
ncbi:lanthionine synthetase LanC family protein [Mucilaginibacter angelicae]|uniref:non-specific serine/threonine protein kinase n=1 Tax=Mucilaginibacter angelicae TaxID=869718 RepID=A0ABV6L590_9SPHI